MSMPKSLYDHVSCMQQWLFQAMVKPLHMAIREPLGVTVYACQNATGKMGLRVLCGGVFHVSEERLVGYPADVGLWFPACGISFVRVAMEGS